MSPKDLCTIDFLDQIADAGIKVLKIEGRGRSADYVKTVSRCYREAVDAYFDKSYTNKKIEMRTGTQYLISVLYAFWLKLRAFYSLFFSPVSSGLGRVTGGRSGTPDRPCSP